MIEVNISKKIKTYNGSAALKINTSFLAGRVTQIFGPSGSGKTTFLKIMSGLIDPDEGYITVDSEVWLNTKAKINLPVQQRNLGFVFQDYALFPNMTVEQHLFYGTKDRQYVQRLLEMGKLTDFINHKPKQLSGGQQQRLAILRAFTTKPKILFLDEPFSALDPLLKAGLIVDLKQLLAELGTTCLIVTHYPMETKGFAEDSFELG